MLRLMTSARRKPTRNTPVKPRVKSTVKRAAEARLDAVFSALADPTRRRILLRLSQGDASVGELAEPFRMSLPGVSTHLRVLERAGLLRRERDGRVHPCRLDAAPLEAADEFITRYRTFWDQTLEGLARYLERGKPR
jgi:DNA-binding transcriptional ArsR family regulator